MTKNTYFKKQFSSVENCRDFSEKEYWIMRANFKVEIYLYTLFQFQNHFIL